MKLHINNIVWIMLFVLTACNDEMEFYNYPSNSLNFVFDEYLSDTVIHKTMVYYPEAYQKDTVWVKLRTYGFVLGNPRKFSLKQVPVGEWDAVPGIHYIPFNDSSVADYYSVAADTNEVEVPIIFLRDTSLENHEYILKIRIDENEYFKPGIEKYQTRTICISDIIVQPKYWNYYAIKGFAGNYGKVKYRFMINAAATIGTILDDKFFEDLVGKAPELDYALLAYWNSFFKTKLKEENNKRKEQGLPPLSEEPKPGITTGELVSFDL